jgi:flagellar export protein FliJ
MKPKAFRLERVLRVRRRDLDGAAATFATAQAELASARAHADACRDGLNDAQTMRRSRLDAGVPAGEHQVAELVLDTERASLGHAREREAACASRTEETRGLLLAARSRVRALEKLRDRWIRNERAHAERTAQAESDEVGARIARRGSGTR